MPATFLSALLFALTLIPQAVLCLGKRQDVSIATTFNYNYTCSEVQTQIIDQAHTDALLLADAALDQGRELFNTPNANSKTVIFNTKAAIDYWGPTKKNGAYQNRIVNTFYRATQTYRGFGWSDWWYNRYVDVGCDFNNSCPAGRFAWTESNGTYPRMKYCKPYFDGLKNHGTMVKRVQDDKTGKLKLNVRNLESQGEYSARLSTRQPVDKQAQRLRATSLLIATE